MPSDPSARQAFATATTTTAREARIRAWAERRIERLSARHEAAEPKLVAHRYKQLLLSDHAQPALRPGWASEDRQTWLMRAAKYQIAREHQARLHKVRDVAEHMVAKGGNSRTKNNGDIGR